jgi:hypothetical protein
MTKRRSRKAGCSVPFEGYSLVRPRDAEDNGSCGRPIVTSVGGVDVSAEKLCVPHWQLKHGAAALKEPIEVAP